MFHEQILKKWRWKKSIALSVTCTENLKNPKTSYIFDKALVFSIICDNHGGHDEIMIKEKESIEIVKIVDLINNSME